MTWTTTSGADLIRAEIWSRELKELLLDTLQGTGYVKWLQEFPDGNLFTIPSVGQATVRDYKEDTGIKYDAMDTGEFQFAITEYVSSGTYITDKMKQDAYYSAQLISSFVPKERRALDERLETDVLGVGQPDATINSGQPGTKTQTKGGYNLINSARHRFLGSGTSATMAVQDFSRAKYALKKANVPLSSLVAIVDPSVAVELETLTNIVNVSNNPQWEGIINTGLTTGMRFIKNIYGFDIYESNYLTQVATTVVGGDFTETAGQRCNIFFSAAGDDVKPFVGAWRQMPNVEYERNKDFQRDEYVTTARYGLKLYRPENLVTVVTAADQVYA